MHEQGGLAFLVTFVPVNGPSIDSPSYCYRLSCLNGMTPAHLRGRARCSFPGKNLKQMSAEG